MNTNSFEIHSDYSDSGSDYSDSDNSGHINADRISAIVTFKILTEIYDHDGYCSDHDEAEKTLTRSDAKLCKIDIYYPDISRIYFEDTNKHFKEKYSNCSPIANDITKYDDNMIYSYGYRSGNSCVNCGKHSTLVSIKLKKIVKILSFNEIEKN